MKSLRLFPLALSVMMIGLCVFVGVTLAQAPRGQPLPPHLLPDNQIEAPAPFDPAALNHFQRDLLFPSSQTAPDAPMPTPTPVMPTQLMDPVGSDLNAPQAFPWQPSQIIYDGTQLCGEQQSPDVAVDAAGNAYAVWQDCRNLHGNYNWDIYFAYRPAGGNWGANVKVNDDAGSTGQTNPSVDVDAAGNAYAVWQDSRNGSSDIYFAYRPAGGSWGANQQVGDNLGAAYQNEPAIAVDDVGNAYAVWRDYRNDYGDIYFAYRPAGGSWSANQRVDDDPNGAHQHDPAIAVDSIGNTYAVWQDYRNGNGDIYFAYRPVGSSWGVNQRVDDDPWSTEQERPAVAVDDAGNAYAVWQDYRNGHADVYFTYRPTSGSWNANQRVNDDSGSTSQGIPDIAVDDTGNAYSIWEDWRDYNLGFYFAYRPVGGSWGANQRVNDVPPNTSSPHSPGWWWKPALDVDVAGNAYAMWMDWRNENDDIYFAYKSTGGAWGINQRVNNDGTTEQSTPVIAVDGAGNTYAVWRGGYNGNNDIYFAYRPAGGSWGTNIKVNDDSDSASQEAPALAVDGAGNAFAVWQDSRNGNRDVYFAYRPTGGSWGANIKVNDDTGTAVQDTPALAVDEAGNAYAVWQDQRNGNPRIYFAFRPAGGSWGVNQQVNDNPVGAWRHEPAVAVDGAGNAYAVWQDWRNSEPDVYFAYRPAGGSWSANLKVNEDTTGEQYNPNIAVDMSGNAYAVWQDWRNGDPDIYFAYRPAGGNWGTNQRVNNDSENATQETPGISVDSSGNAYTVWSDWRGQIAVYFAYRPAGGSWNTEQRIDDNPNSEQYHPTITADAVGNAYVVWADNRHTTPHVFFSYALHDHIVSDPPTAIAVNTTSDVADGNTASFGDLLSNPGPDGVIALREALMAANNMSGPKTITFAIPTSDPGYNPADLAWTIRPTSELPWLTSGQVTLNASTQGLSAYGGPSMELDGTLATSYGLALASGGNEVRGFVINRSAYVGISLSGTDAVSNTVAGNYVGTDIEGSTAQPNGQHGVVLEWGASYNRIGGIDPADRNVISGNNWHGIENWGDGTSYNVIQGNYIGTDVTGMTAVGNRGKGVSITPSAHDILVGGAEPGARNVIAFNGSDNGEAGVDVAGPSVVRYNRISRNSIYGDGGPGIKVESTANNGIQPPQIISVTENSVIGTACAHCTIEVFSDAADEGRYYEGTVTAGPNGHWSWGGAPTLPRFTTTATDADGNTSEFSQVATYVPNDPWSVNERIDDGQRGCDQYNPTTALGSDGTIYAAWEECRNGHGDIYAARSSDSGVTWSTPVRVNDDAGRSWQYDPAMTIASNGVLYLVWEDWRQSGGPLFLARSSDGGATWSQNVRVTPGSTYRYDPAISVDTGGRLYVAWYQSSSTYSDIYAVTSSDGGDTWSSPHRVTDDVGVNSYQYRPAVSGATDGVAYVAWEDRRGGPYRIYAAATSDGGTTWSANRRVDDDAGTQSKYMTALAVAANGHVHAAWYDYRNGNSDIFVARSTDSGVTWSPNVRVDDDPGTASQLYPTLLATEDGKLWVAWYDSRAGFQVRIGSSSDGGLTWTASTRVDDNPGSGTVSLPVLTGHSNSQLTALWLDSRSGSFDLRGSSSSNSGISWHTSSQLNQSDTGTARQNNVRLAMDTLGNALAVWEDYNIYSGTPLYAAARPAGTQGSAGPDMHPWSDNVRVDATYTSQYAPDLLSDGLGTWYAVWHDYRTSSPHIYAARSTDNGATWTTSVRVSDSTATSSKYSSHLARDSAGSLYVVWWDSRNGNNLYLAKSTDQGQTWSTNQLVPPAGGLESWRGADLVAVAPGELYLVWEQFDDIWFSASLDGGATWSAAQRINDDTTNLQSTPSLGVAPDGVIHVVWRDYRNNDSDIYYVTRDSSGAWGPNLRVNDDAGVAAQYSPDLAIDQAGNAHLVWYDYRNGDGDIYYAYRPAGGVWSANGKVDDAVLSSQTSPRVAVDGAGNAYTAWIDDRAGPSHPYFAWLQYANLPQRTPTPQITFPLPGATNQNSLVVQGLACPGCQVSIYDGETLLSVVTAAANGEFSHSVVLGGGNHLLTAVAQHTAGSAALLAPATWLPSLPSVPVPLGVDTSLRIDPQRLTLTYTMWGGQSVVLRPRDAAGLLVNCTGEANIPGFRIRPDLPNTLTVAVSGSPTQVQVIVSGIAVFDLAPIGDDVWETTFTVDATHDLTIRISDDGGATFVNQCTGQILIDPQGVVSDAGTGQPIQGATVTCYVATEGGEWARWPAENYDGQTNPQYTADNGFYAFFTPPGSYQIEAWAPGYVLQRTGTIIVTSQLVEVNLALQPVVAPCPADLNGDGEVSVTDIIAIAEKWNAVSPNFPYAPGFDLMPVGAPDGAITIADIQFVAAHWGETCTP